MFTKTDSEFLKTQRDTKLDNQATRQSAKITNSDKQELSDFKTDLGESNFELGLDNKNSNPASSYTSAFAEGDSQIWSGRNKILAALAIALLLVGFSIYHFQGGDEEYAQEENLAENSEQLDLSEDQEEMTSEDQFDSENSDLESIANIDEVLVDDPAGEESVMETQSESVAIEDTEQEESALVNTEPYTIVRGDWLSKIAKRRLGDAMLWPKVWVLNPQIENPDLIYPGNVITVPKHSRNYADKSIW
ncbi:MAG: LysM peptidoglycan-binding domain-containing protein [Oligoflexales bacterium]